MFRHFPDHCVSDLNNSDGNIEVDGDSISSSYASTTRRWEKQRSKQQVSQQMSVAFVNSITRFAVFNNRKSNNQRLKFKKKELLHCFNASQLGTMVGPFFQGLFSKEGNDFKEDPCDDRSIV